VRLLIAVVVDFLATLALMVVIYVAAIIYSNEAPSGSASKFVAGLAFWGIAVVPCLAVALRLAALAFRKQRHETTPSKITLIKYDT
jgi:ribose/xylose/arabinose/galactoside ABC-type transport system permease subunit